MEIARETAFRAQAERKREGMFELDDNARLQTRSGILGASTFHDGGDYAGPDNHAKRSATASHPVPSKLIDSLFGATHARRSALHSSREKEELRVDDPSEASQHGASTRVRRTQASKAVKANHFDSAVQDHSQTLIARVAVRRANPLAVSPGMLNPEEITVNRKRLEASLKCNGMYPKKYRLLVWRFLLRLPKNEEAFRTLVMKGKHPAFLRLHEQYPLQNSRIFRRLHRVLSAIAYWCPAFGEVSYLPEVVYPFIKIFRENDLAAFEASLSVLLHWCGDFLRSLPYPPVVVLRALDKQLAKRDPQLHSHMVQHQIDAGIYGWSLLKTVFTEVVSEDEWMCLWDHLFTYSERPRLLCVAVLAYLSYFRTALLAASDRFSIEQFFHQQNAINMQAFLQLVMHISQQIDLKSFTDQETGIQVDGERGESVVRSTAYWPLPSGQYPAFASYPKFVVDFQISVRVLRCIAVLVPPILRSLAVCCSLSL